MSARPAGVASGVGVSSAVLLMSRMPRFPTRSLRATSGRLCGSVVAANRRSLTKRPKFWPGRVTVI